MAFKVSQKFFNLSEDSENIKNTVICPIVIIQDENSKLYKFHPKMKAPKKLRIFQIPLMWVFVMICFQKRMIIKKPVQVGDFFTLNGEHRPHKIILDYTFLNCFTLDEQIDLTGIIDNLRENASNTWNDFIDDLTPSYWKEFYSLWIALLNLIASNLSFYQPEMIIYLGC